LFEVDQWIGWLALAVAAHGAVIILRGGFSRGPLWVWVGLLGATAAADIIFWRSRLLVQAQALAILGASGTFIATTGGAPNAASAWMFLLVLVYPFVLADVARAVGLSVLAGVVFVVSAGMAGSQPMPVFTPILIVISGLFGVALAAAYQSRIALLMELDAALRSRDEMLSAIAHELRTPLTSIIGYADLLARNQMGESPRLDEQILYETIIREGQELGFVIDDLIAAARADLGTIQVFPVPTDVVAEVQKAVDIHEARTGQEVQVVADKGVPAMVDPYRLRQILRSLLRNAHQHGGPDVAVHARMNEHPFVVVVDNGPGIPPRDINRLFDRYEKAHEISGMAPSLGLGLAVSKVLAELMDGDLAYQYENGLSQFALSLRPLVQTMS
jgi:signal transduction histidine kinase